MTHDNLQPIDGMAARLGVPSRHRLSVDYSKGTVSPGAGILISHAAAEPSLQTIIGMGINALTEPYKNFAPYTLNVPRRSVGFISEAWTDVDLLRVKGFVWGFHHPDVLAEIRKGGLGMCLALTYHKDAPVIDGIISPKIFLCTGVALMKKECCGFDSEVSLGFPVGA
jgi:hypothetical protein